jgi:hypothetical protein
VLDKEEEFRQQHDNEDCDDETLHDMALNEVADDDKYLATCISALSDDNLMSDYETDEDQPAEPGNKIIIRKQPSYRSREVFNNVLQIRVHLHTNDIP